MVQTLQDRDLAHERALAFVSFRLVCGGHAPGLALQDHLDREPLPGSARDGLHDGGERALAEFMADIVECVYATLGWAIGGVAIDEA